MNFETAHIEIAEIENKIFDVAAPPIVEESITYYPADSCKGLDYSGWLQVEPCRCRTCKEPESGKEVA